MCKLLIYIMIKHIATQLYLYYSYIAILANDTYWIPYTYSVVQNFDEKIQINCFDEILTNSANYFTSCSHYNFVLHT